MSARSPRRLRRRHVVIGLVGVLAVVLVLGALLAWQGWRALRNGEQANDDLRAFRAEILDRDIDGARASLADAQQHSAAARSALGGPWWGLVGVVPSLGDDVTAARQLSVVVDDVTQGALPAAVTALSFADPRDIGLQDGRIQLGPVRDASAQLTRAAELLRGARDDAGDIKTSGLTASLGDRIVDVQDQLDQTSRLATVASQAAELLPDMLGDSGERDYLLLAQNNAEQRSLGGLVGAMVQVRADDGRLSLVRQVVPADFGSFDRPILPLTESERALYGDVLGQFPGNVTNSPDFPRAAQLITAMWEDRIGGELDGVAAVDPWALQLILKAIGPVDTDAGELTGRNAAQVLLNDVYLTIPDPGRQNAVFAQAARAVFDAVRGFEGEPRALTEALVDGVEQGRVMVWSADEQEQDVLARTKLGQTLTDPSPSSPRLGVYLQDLVQSKIDAYQRVRIDVRPDSCDMTESAEVEISLRSTVPADAELPEAVTGNGSQAPAGDVKTRVAVYAPQGWTFEGFSSSDGQDTLTTFQDAGLSAAFRDFQLNPGQSASVTLRLVGPAVSPSWDVRFTPGTKPANVRSDVSGC